MGLHNAPDTELLAHARAHGRTVLTQDLDFAQLLFATRDSGPSVVLLRVADEFNAAVRERVCEAIRCSSGALATGALLTISATITRLRRLPIIP